ncbi:MAG: response regulator [Spirochaetota bacterium]
MEGKAILCVDDEDLLLFALEDELRAAFGNRFVYETATGAEQGLVMIERLAREGIRTVLVISDWMMPGIKGDEFLRLVGDKHPGTKGILITGHAEEEAIAKVLGDRNVLAVLRKPWKAGELKRIIEAGLDS